MYLRVYVFQIFWSISIAFIFILNPGTISAGDFLLNDGEETYQWYCAACHGKEGDGKGFNANNLDPRPADHTDNKLMNKRTDDELYNVIEGGGRAAGKSTLMPPWGNSFSEAQMEALVLYLRKLCRCKM